MKEKSTVALLALFLGGLGIHRFYLGNTVLAIIYILFCWTFIPAILGFIEGIYFLTMSQESFDIVYNGKKPGVPLKQPVQNIIQPKPVVNTMDEIDKLFTLKEKGAITEEEFLTQKAKLLQ